MISENPPGAGFFAAANSALVGKLIFCAESWLLTELFA